MIKNYLTDAFGAAMGERPFAAAASGVCRDLMSVLAPSVCL
jgi:hypothetical protein